MTMKSNAGSWVRSRSASPQAALAGYQVLADSIDLSLFSRDQPACR
ncbi:hypothetical protein ABZ897_31940 [Nonomuraea sp. NPDC046802]